MHTHKFISGSQLKWLAIITMFFDHIAKIISFQPPIIAAVPYGITNNSFLEASQILFAIFITFGRLSFPIFCFLLVEGFIHTSNRQKYACRLLLFALISQIPYSLAFSQQLFHLGKLNVFFTLLIGLFAIMGINQLKKCSFIPIASSLLIAILGIVAAELLNTDYGGKIGVLLIIVLYVLRENHLYKTLVGILVIFQSSIFGMLAFPILLFYNEKRGKQWKYFFYLFYPAHLLLLVAIQKFVIVPFFLVK